jgi:uncharacterized protein YwqG
MFPKSLLPYQQIIESTAMPAVLMSFRKEKTALYQSKTGGLPYFQLDYSPDDSPWPTHPKTGLELLLLIQLNFEELPPLPSFPRTGILQLFVDKHHSGDNLNNHLQIIYHPYVVRDKEKLFTNFDTSMEERAISFRKETEYMTHSDFRFNQLLPDIGKQGNNRLWTDYERITSHRYYKQRQQPGYEGGRNKIGGYHFSQRDQDPRASRAEWKDSLLLVQLQDWTDERCAKFFIQRKDLEKCNFQNLLFHFD